MDLANVGLVVVAALFGLAPFILPLVHRWSQSGSRGSFFEIDYITWFLLRFSVAGAGLSLIALLGIDGVLDKSVIAGLVGALLGYVLTSVSHGSPPAKTGGDVPAQTQTAKPPAGGTDGSTGGGSS